MRAIEWYVTSPIAMGHMFLDYFSNIKSWDAKNKHDNEDGTWPWIMCPHTLKKRSKPLIETFTTKQCHKNSYTTPKGRLEERQCEQAKVETNASRSKINFVPRLKSSTKKGKSTLAGEWRRRRTLLVSLDGTTCVLKVNARIAQMHSPTWARAHVWHNCGDGSGVGSKVDSKCLWEARTSALIMYSSYNAF
jgi:hypothetical protein